MSLLCAVAKPTPGILWMRSDMTTTTLTSLFEAYKLERLPSKATIKHYDKLLSLFRREIQALHQNPEKVRSLKRDTVLQWRVIILDRAARTTWNNYSNHMRTLWRFGLEAGLLKNNPWEKMRVRTPKKKKKTIPVDSIKTAINTLNSAASPLQPGWFWAIVLRTLYQTGIRRRQLIGIRLKDVDVEKGFIRLRAEYSKNAEERWIPILEPVAKDMIVLFTHHNAIRALHPDDQVFNVTRFYSRYFGDKMVEEQVTGFFARLSNLQLVDERLSAHRFRHTFGTELASKTDLKTLQELMGHKDFRSTMEYMHSDIDRQRGVLSQLPLL